MRRIVLSLVVLFCIGATQSHAAQRQSKSSMRVLAQQYLSDVQSETRILAKQGLLQHSMVIPQGDESTDWLSLGLTYNQAALQCLAVARDGYNDWYDLSMAWDNLEADWYCLYMATGNPLYRLAADICSGFKSYCYKMHQRYD